MRQAKGTSAVWGTYPTRPDYVMRAFLFNRAETEAYQLLDTMTLYFEGLEQYDGPFSHSWGGDEVWEGLVPPGCKKPVHVFIDLDLSDPRVGFKLPGKHNTFLPLLYALGNCGGPFQYRVVQTGKIELLSQPYPPKYRRSIMKDYPEPFERGHLSLLSRKYDPADVHDVFFCGGVLGIAALNKRQKAKLRKDFLAFYRDEIGIDLIEEDYDGDDSVTIDEIVSGYSPFTQGEPDDPCPYPECENHKAGTPLPVLAYLEPERDDPFYNTLAGGDDGQLIWQVCEKCGSIVVTHPIT
jgi:hypothetical protein